ncbi:MAG TPA: AAA family ATPase [Paracoccus sp. (in: a-proteobacteria)]|uniref:AAA family ATPase n=1 Tax=uncultured Paracoccus sp. TaxID=189685 RepID=UPI00260EA078|nr:AAA family ATPase [uncultured Paracoccus sp.]HMQ42570.1 AAA family ATPase [Paracoccus sp. (in: a-proteobacteria)]HMR37701.1 AAA family ATPase [Paracoccus sp. (in: a-proteobacteria)]
MSVPAVDPAQIALFLDVVFSWCDGLIPLRGLPEKGVTPPPPSDLRWLPADAGAPATIAGCAEVAAPIGRAIYVIPGTVAQCGEARAGHVLQMQALVVDLDQGDIVAKRDHLIRHLGPATLTVESGGITEGGQKKLHLWWKLSEPAHGADIARLCRLRAEIARKVGGDGSFGSAHQPVRVPGTIHGKYGLRSQVRIIDHQAIEVDLAEFETRAIAMPALAEPSSSGTPLDFNADAKPSVDEVLTTPVREGAADDWTRFQGASAAIGHYLRQAHEGRMTLDEAWEAICSYNAAMLRPPWPQDRLKAETRRLWQRHLERNGPAQPPRQEAPTGPLDCFSLGQLLDDRSALPDDIIAPRVLTPGGLLVLGGAPKVGKSDFLISWLVHMAAGVPFLGFTPPRPLRVFYLQAELQYHYLRERLHQIGLPPEVLDSARDGFVATPRLKLLLDGGGVARVAEAVRSAFRDSPPDVLCIDPIRNVFDGGPDSGGENDNSAMMFFLRERVEALQAAVNPDAGVILVHHTKKLSKQQVKDDPFLALSGASALRGYYTTGLILHRPDEDSTARRLEIELRNGPALEPKLVDKIGGTWVEVSRLFERVVGQEIGAKHDAERDRKRDVILSILLAEAAEGRLYTSTQFREAFENQFGLGSQSTIRDRINVLSTKGYIRFLRDGTEFGHEVVRSRFGYLCVHGMVFGSEAQVDPESGEVLSTGKPVVPSHYKSPANGLCMELEDPCNWPDPEDDHA